MLVKCLSCCLSWTGYHSFLDLVEQAKIKHPNHRGVGWQESTSLVNSDVSFARLTILKLNFSQHKGRNKCESILYR